MTIRSVPHDPAMDTVPCPTCKREAGRCCVTNAGDIRGPHVARLQAYNNYSDPNNKPVRLCDVPRDTYIRLLGEPGQPGVRLYLHHADGMYSLCTTEHGATTHIGSAQMVMIDHNQEV